MSDSSNHGLDLRWLPAGAAKELREQLEELRGLSLQLGGLWAKHAREPANAALTDDIAAIHMPLRQLITRVEITAASLEHLARTVSESQQGSDTGAEKVVH